MRRTAAVLIGLTLGAAACSGGDDTAAGGEGESPLAEFLGEDVLGFDPENQEAMEQQFLEQERKQQDLIAACMTEQGFEYTPHVQSVGSFFGTEEGIEFGSTEYVAKYGFGITTQRFSQSQVGPDLVGYDDSGFEDAVDDDPNSARLETMSDAERQAYEEALWGNDFFVEPDPTLTEEEQEALYDDAFSGGPGGCYGEAIESDTANRFYIEFDKEIGEMFEAIEADERIVAANAEISTCVGDKGLEYTNESDLFERFESELSALDGGIGDPFADITEEEIDAMSDAERDTLFSQGPPELSDEEKATLADLQREEIELAVAVDECGGGFAAQQELFEEIRVEYDEKFLADNADKLEDYRAS